MKWPCLVALAAGCGGGSPCGPTSGHVARVVDGDTIELESGEKIRYLMIDTPESTTETECFGENAKQFNTDLVADKDIELAYDVECEDRFGRLLAYVTVGGVEVNTLMVERGFACVLHIPPNGDDREDEFDALEAAAKAANRGLWGACMSPFPC
jgi:micrococcal nuclease